MTANTMSSAPMKMDLTVSAFSTDLEAAKEFEEAGADYIRENVEDIFTIRIKIYSPILIQRKLLFVKGTLALPSAGSGT